VVPERTDDFVRDFVVELVRSAHLFGPNVCRMIEALPEDEFPGEDRFEVVVDLVVEAVGHIVARWGEEEEVRSAASLVGCTTDRARVDGWLWYALKRSEDARVEEQDRQAD
jgi:hypothetical protein